jgi:hypothetical protein
MTGNREDSCYDGSSWRVFGGYRFNRFVGLEVGWIGGGSVGKG